MPKLNIPTLCAVSLAALTLTGTTAAAVAAREARTAKAPVTPKPGRYSGTAGPFTLSFKVTADSKKITHLVTMYNPAADCGIPTNGQSEGFPALAIRKGRFTGSTVLSPPSGTEVSFSIQGSFSTPTRAAGTIHGHLTVTSLPPCNDHVSFIVQRIGK